MFSSYSVEDVEEQEVHGISTRAAYTSTIKAMDHGNGRVCILSLGFLSFDVVVNN